MYIVQLANFLLILYLTEANQSQTSNKGLFDQNQLIYQYFLLEFLKTLYNITRS
jgi:hypothetical protein